MKLYSSLSLSLSLSRTSTRLALLLLSRVQDLLTSIHVTRRGDWFWIGAFVVGTAQNREGGIWGLRWWRRRRGAPCFCGWEDFAQSHSRNRKGKWDPEVVGVHRFNVLL